MCMIVDANVLGMFLLQPKNPDTAPIHEWLGGGWGSIVYSNGGRFETDIAPRNRERLAGLVRAGQARLVPRERVEPHEAEFGNIRSNDPHVLALAQAAGVRLLYTRDRKLRADFRDRKFIGGTIYRDRRDGRLLTDDACAGG